MKQGWAPSPLSGVNPHPSIPYTKLRREKLSKQYPGVRLVFPAGSLKIRSNDSDYPFRAHSVFSWFTGIIAPRTVDLLHQRTYAPSPEDTASGLA